MKVDSGFTRTRLAVLFERVWRAFFVPYTVVTVFLSLSLLGLFEVMPVYGRELSAATFFCLLCVSFDRLASATFPSLEEGIEEVDRRSGIPHRPATAVHDTPVNADTVSDIFWREHVFRQTQKLKNAPETVPSPRMVDRDPYALRLAVWVLLIASAVVAGSRANERLLSPFDWNEKPTTAVPWRVDAWVESDDSTTVLIDDSVVRTRSVIVSPNEVLHVGATDGSLLEIRPDGSISARGRGSFSVTGKGSVTVSYGETKFGKFEFDFPLSREQQSSVMKKLEREQTEAMKGKTENRERKQERISKQLNRAASRIPNDSESREKLNEAKKESQDVQNELKTGKKKAALEGQKKVLEAIKSAAPGKKGKGIKEGKNGSGKKRVTGASAQKRSLDPLGRPAGTSSGNRIESERADTRKITDELRKRLSDPNLSVKERRYLESLLEHD